MMTFKNILKESIFVPRRSRVEREKNYIRQIYRYIKSYVNSGSKGDLDLTNTHIKVIPDFLKNVGGALLIHNSMIEKLPTNLTVHMLGASASNIKELPKRLKVIGDARLRSILSITEIPKDMYVGGELDVMYSGINKWDGATVIGNLYLTGTPLAAKLRDKLTIFLKQYERKYNHLYDTNPMDYYTARGKAVDAELKRLIPGVNGEIILY